MNRRVAVADTNVVVLITGDAALQRDPSMRGRVLAPRAYVESWNGLPVITGLR